MAGLSEYHLAWILLPTKGQIHSGPDGKWMSGYMVIKPV